MNEELLIPISWKNYQEYGLSTDYFFIEFLDNFGIFFKGEKYESLGVFYKLGIVEVYNNNGEVIKSQKFKLTPIFDEEVIIPEIKNTIS